MARRSRQDTPGSWHHVMNRGIARRPLFENREDVRYFLSRLAREVRRGRIELHSWCVMTTHYHLLARSPRGEVSEALRRSQNEYARFFNRRHRRDGALIRGRFRSKPVDSLTYRRNLVRYIDANPVVAGIVDDASAYPYGSARQYTRHSGPPWLTRTWVEHEVTSTTSREFRPDDYSAAFPASRDAALARLIERRLERGDGPDPLDQLVEAASSQVRAWMIRKAKLADGTREFQPLCDSSSVQAAVTTMRVQAGEWRSPSACRAPDLWTVAESGLLRDIAGLTWAEIADLCGCSTATSHSRHRLHARLLVELPGYADRVSRLTASALERCFGRPAR